MHRNMKLRDGGSTPPSGAKLEPLLLPPLAFARLVLAGSFSRQPFEDYIEQHIFGPLGMTHATFRQPLPKDLQSLMSQGYERASGGAKEFEVVTPFPAGSVAISAMDITHFMIAQLQEGTYNGAQILPPEAITLMHTRQYAPDPRVNAMCLGFYEETRNGHRIIGHGIRSTFTATCI